MAAPKTKKKASRRKPKTLAERATASFKSTQESTREATRKGALHMAHNVIDLQHSAFSATMEGLEKLEKRTGKLLHNISRKASWMPEEGKEAVDEWVHTAKKGRSDFSKSMDHSFTLLKTYFERIEKESAPKKKAKSKAKPKPKKKAAAKRKPAAKKKAASKSKTMAKSHSVKKPAARKKTPGKK